MITEESPEIQRAPHHDLAVMLATTIDSYRSDHTDTTDEMVMAALGVMNCAFGSKLTGKFDRSYFVTTCQTNTCVKRGMVMEAIGGEK